jgi:transposase
MKMTQRQWQRLELVKRIEQGKLTITQCAKSLGLSKRQVKRLRKKIRLEGDKGVLHGNTGRAPKHKTPSALCKRVLSLRRNKYDGFNDVHFAEKLAEAEGIELSGETIRRILRAAGIGSPRKRRQPRHRRRRDRQPRAGEMILWDGSRHDWLEGRGPQLCLVGAIDDATGEVLPGAHFVEQECTLSYLRVLRAVVREKGVPLTAYMDRHGTLKRNDANWTMDEQLAGRQEPTQVGRALNDFGIGAIFALSPQAKGRVERLWGTLQDRLVSELRLANASNADDAHRVLKKYLPEHNARFAIAPQAADAAWRSAPSAKSIDDVCSIQCYRLVANNNTVRVDGRIIDIPKHPSRATFAKCEVLVCHHLNGRYRIFFKSEHIASDRGEPPTDLTHEPRRRSSWLRMRQYQERRRNQDGVTESLTG